DLGSKPGPASATRRSAARSTASLRRRVESKLELRAAAVVALRQPGGALAPSVLPTARRATHARLDIGEPDEGDPFDLDARRHRATGVGAFDHHHAHFVPRKPVHRVSPSCRVGSAASVRYPTVVGRHYRVPAAMMRSHPGDWTWRRNRIASFGSSP